MKNVSNCCWRGGWVAVVGVLLGSGPVAAQAPAWQLATALGSSTSTVSGLASDAAGSLYLTGTFSGTFSLGGISLVSAGSNDLFVAKYDAATSRCVWAQRFGGTGNDRGNALAVAGSQVFIAGTFENTVSFGAATLSSAGSGDAVVVKILDQGTVPAVAWAQAAGGNDNDDGWALALSGTSVYLGGTVTSNQARFGPLSFTTSGNADGFVAKLADAGTSAAFSWVQGLGGAYYDEVFALTANGSSIFAGGLFSRTATFGGSTLTAIGAADAMVVKLTDNGTSGNVRWVQQGGSTADDRVYGLTTSGTDVYAAGSFSTTASFGSTALTTAGGSDVFVAKIADAGASAAYTWVQQAGGSGNDFGAAVAVANGSVYVAGGASGTASFGTGTVTSAGGYDTFVTRLVDAGSSAQFRWAQRGGGSLSDFSTSISLNNQGLFVAGTVGPPAIFGTIAVPAGTSSAVGLLAALGPGALAAAPAAEIAAVAIYPNPAHGRATVHLPLISGTITATLTLLDALGRSLYHQTAATNSKIELDLSGFTPGIYAVRVASGTALAVRRVVVE